MLKEIRMMPAAASPAINYASILAQLRHAITANLESGEIMIGDIAPQGHFATIQGIMIPDDFEAALKEKIDQSPEDVYKKYSFTIMGTSIRWQTQSAIDRAESALYAQLAHQMEKIGPSELATAVLVPMSPATPIDLLQIQDFLNKRYLAYECKVEVLPLILKITWSFRNFAKFKEHFPNSDGSRRVTLEAHYVIECLRIIIQNYETYVAFSTFTKDGETFLNNEGIRNAVLTELQQSYPDAIFIFEKNAGHWQFRLHRIGLLKKRDKFLPFEKEHRDFLDSICRLDEGLTFHFVCKIADNHAVQVYRFFCYCIGYIRAQTLCINPTFSSYIEQHQAILTSQLSTRFPRKEIIFRTDKSQRITLQWKTRTESEC
jgi:hypothetical protein